MPRGGMLAAGRLPRDRRLQFWWVDTNHGVPDYLLTTFQDPGFYNPVEAWAPHSRWILPNASPGSPEPALPYAVDAANLSDGRTQIWVMDDSGNLYSRWKLTTDPDSDWSAWEQWPYEGVLSFGVGPISDYRLQVFAVNGNGELVTSWKSSEDPSSPWTDWQQFPLPPSSSELKSVLVTAFYGNPAQILGLAPRMQIFAFDQTYHLWTCRKQSVDPNAGWTQWVLIDLPSALAAIAAGGPPFLTPLLLTAGNLSDNRPQVWLFAAGGDAPLFTRWKETTDPGSEEWTPWTEFSTPQHDNDQAGVIIDMTAAPLQDDRLQLWAMDSNYSRWTCWKLTSDPNSPWTTWWAFNQ